MALFYWQLLRRVPSLLLESTSRVRTAAFILLFLLTSFNRQWGRMIASKWEGVPPWYSVVLVLLYVAYALLKANYADFRDLEEERDRLRVAPPPHPARPPEPRWMSGGSAEYRQLVARLEDDDYEVKEPTPEGAQEHLNSGWERISFDGRPVVTGGRLDRPDHWPIFRRVASYGLSDNSKRLIVAAYMNTIRHHSFQYIPAGYKAEPNLTVVDPPFQLKGDEARKVLEELVGAGLATREDHADGTFYVLKTAAAEAASWLQRKGRVPR